MNYKVAYNKPTDAAKIKELKEKDQGDACPISSSEIAGAIIGREVSSKEHSEFIDSFIDNIGD